MVYNLYIEGSSHMSRHEFEVHVFFYHADDRVVKERSARSLLEEWAAHKLLYCLHLWRSHTESVDLNWPQKWYAKLGYFIVGEIGLLIYG